MIDPTREPREPTTSPSPADGPDPSRGHVGSVARLIGVVVQRRQHVPIAPVHGVDLQVDPGTLTVLAGGPDSGHETVLHILSGHVSVDAGQVEIAGVHLPSNGLRTSPVTDPKAWRSRVGYVPERPAAVGYLTVTENLLLPTTLAGTAGTASRVARLLRTLRLEAVQDRYPDEIETWQRRLLALGQALAYTPDLVVVPADTVPGVTRPELATALVELVDLDGHTVVTALTDPLLRASRGRVVEFIDGRIARQDGPAPHLSHPHPDPSPPQLSPPDPSPRQPSPPARGAQRPGAGPSGRGWP